MIALVRANGGLLIWAAAFSVMYGAHGIGCERGWAGVAVAGTSLHLLVLAVLWVSGLAAIAAYGWLNRGARDDRAGSRLIDRLTWGLSIVGFISLVFTGGPILLYPACL